LHDELICVEVSILILAWFEHDTGLSTEWSIRGAIRSESIDTPVTTMQASPLSHQEVRDHKQLPLTFWFGGWLAVLMVSTGFPLIILKEN
jgi:hypothetical protein